jgi:hypothetical protein
VLGWEDLQVEKKELDFDEAEEGEVGKFGDPEVLEVECQRIREMEMG